MLLPLYDLNPHARWPLVTALLIAANIGCYFWSTQGGQDGFTEVIFKQGFVPQRLTRLDDPQPVKINLELPDGGNIEGELSTKPEEVYPTLFTSMFLHGGLLHLIANLWMLWVFGDNVEDRLGRVVYLFFYVVGGLLAMLSQWFSDPMSTTPVIGASGAIAAVLGAYAITFPMAKVKTLVFIGIPLFLSLPSALVLGGWLLLNLMGGLQAIDGQAEIGVRVAYWTHIGGFVAGVILMPLLTLGAEPTDKDWRTESREMFEF